MATDQKDFLDDVQRALEGISEAQYNFDIAYVGRHDRIQASEGKRPAIIWRWVEETLTSSGAAIDELDGEFKLVLEGILDYSSFSGVSVDEQNRLLKDDIQKALLSIDMTQHNVSFLRLRTVPFYEEQPDETVEGVLMEAFYRYAVDSSDPTDFVAP